MQQKESQRNSKWEMIDHMIVAKKDAKSLKLMAAASVEPCRIVSQKSQTFHP